MSHAHRTTCAAARDARARAGRSPVLFAAQRGLHTRDEWSAWLLEVAAPAPLASWDAAFATRAGLAKRHNVHAFLNALYVNARESADANTQALVPGLQAAIKTLR